MSNSANDLPEMTPDRARGAACFVWFLLCLDSGKFLRDNFPHGLEPYPTADDLEAEDLQTYEGTQHVVRSLSATLEQVNDGTQEFKAYKTLLWWCEQVLDGKTSHPSQSAAQVDHDAWPRWARTRGIKRGIYRGGRCA